jgi:hypothetical protein
MASKLEVMETGYIDLDGEIEALREELEKKVAFLEGRIKYLEELIEALAKRRG